MNDSLSDSWSNVVQKVEHANLEKVQEQKQKQHLRKILYRDELFRQMNQSYDHQKKRHLHKRYEKQQMEQKIHDEIQARNAIHKNIRAKQQHYQQDNLKMIHNRLEQLDLEKKKGEWRKYKENPFVKLVDEQDERKQVYRKNLIKQNQINQKQFEYKIKTRREEEMKEKNEKKQFQKYVQNSFGNIDKNRENFKARYLQLQPHEKHKIKTQPNTLQKQYIEYLNHQVNEASERKVQKQKLDKNLTQINVHLDQPDSSPAFLGKSPINHDRQKQLNYLDKQLGLERKNKNPYPRISSVPITESANYRVSLKKMESELNVGNRKSQNYKKSKQHWYRSQQKKEQGRYNPQKLKKEVYRSQVVQVQSPQRKVQLAPITTQRVYKQFNIISGASQHYKFDSPQI